MLLPIHYTWYDALKTVVCLVAVQSLADENEERIDENKTKQKKKTEVPIPSFLFCESSVCVVGKVQENHFPDIGLYYKPITWHRVIRLNCIGSLYGCKEILSNTLYVIYIMVLSEF